MADATTGKVSEMTNWKDKIPGAFACFAGFPGRPAPFGLHGVVAQVHSLRIHMANPVG
ncbi:hypothetical protein SDC9_46433 [bioreactor metagenome]|uniref:Uncharacterized protein n=1 Tax=bioreactor metagenome TaxID=1076179 RepID=A0A644W8W2_9ZZZZ